MIRSEIEKRIVTAFHEVLVSSNSQLSGPLTDDVVLLESGLDSLGFAILVARLEEDLGWDPFSISNDPFYPSTFKDFVSFYDTYQPEYSPA